MKKQNPQSRRRNPFPGGQISQWFRLLPENLSASNYPGAAYTLADVVRQHRYEHARALLEMACQEAANVSDYRPVLQRFLCQAA
jgi:hypothetical protein